MIRKFIGKTMLFSSPLLLVVLSYFIFDPFKVLYSYDNLYEDYFVNINRDYASSQLFIQNNPTQQYNAFIFGSSRTMAFRTSDWRKHIGKSAKPFVFDASSEKISGIWSKLKFLDREKVPIKHVLVVVCGDHTFSAAQEAEGLLFKRHYKVDEAVNFFQFQEVFFSNYLRNYFFVRYLDYRFFRTQRTYMSGNMEFIEVKVDSITNDLYRVDLDRQLLENEDRYYRRMDSLFYQRLPRIAERQKQIDETKREMLSEMKQIFDKHKTDYKIVISPLYDQKKLHSQDLQIIQAVFGKKHVFDFSGVNSYTESKFYYYENSHYRPAVGRSIMDSLYAK